MVRTRSGAFIVADWQRTIDAGDTVISARVGPSRLWFRGSSLPDAACGGDPWLMLALQPAMALGTALDMREMPPISPELLAATERIQDAWTAWNPELRRVEILATVGRPSSPLSERSGTFFSGGVDAIHAALDGGEAGDMLVYLDGFDHALSNDELEALLGRLRPLAAELDGELTAMRTNWTVWRRDLRLSRLLLFGSVLAAAAHLLGVRRMTISSSRHWGNLVPEGSHVLLDPLWSTSQTQIRHWGCHRSRIEKLRRIAERPGLLMGLQVCHAEANENCGSCPKCVRTRAMLRLNDSELPNLGREAVDDPIAEFARMLHRGAEGHYIRECLEVAAASGNSSAVRLITEGESRLRRRRVLRDLSRRLRPGRARQRDMTTDLWPWGFGPETGHP